MNKHLKLILLAVFAIMSIASCKKSKTIEPEDKFPIITGINPTNILTGKLITVTGSNFGTDINNASILLNDEPINISTVNNNTITATIPLDLVKSGSKSFKLEVKVSNQISNSLNINVSFDEPHGWYYASSIPISGGASSPTFSLITFPTENIGFVQRSKYLYRTTDGGATWTGSSNNGGFGFGYSFYSYDGLNSWIEFGSDISLSTDGSKWVSTTLPNTSSNIIMGMYMSSPTVGQIMKLDGLLYNINGSFDAKDVVLEYQSIYTHPIISQSASWLKLSNIDLYNLMIAGTRYVNGSRKAIIAHKKAGTYTEYDISSVTSAESIKALQLINNNTAFLIDGNNDVLKYTGDKTWVKLSQKATAICFKDANTGYASYDGKILKSVDGGASWQTEFTLKPNEQINSITSKNNKMWAIGNGASEGVILKFNP